MRLCIVTDAWKPQVNGVVRTLEATIRALRKRGHEIEVIAPDQFRSFPCPTYPEIRLAITRPRAVAQRIEAVRPQALHIATEGPLGYAARRWAKRNGKPFTTAFHTHFPRYAAQRTGLSENVFWPAMRRFHAASTAVFCATDSLDQELSRQGIAHTTRWSRGVDLSVFDPQGPRDELMQELAGLKPKLLFVGRVAVEKNLEAYLSIETDAIKFVVGDGPQRKELERKFPQAHFLGTRRGKALASLYRTADVFVFPSYSDTFGLVMIEALASGTPVAAFDAMGSRDILSHNVGAIGPDMAANIKRALQLDPLACVAHAQRYDWEAATDMFEDGLIPLNGVDTLPETEPI